MEITEVKIGERNFRYGRLDTMTTMHCARRMGPILVGALPALMAWLDTSEGTSEDRKTEIVWLLLQAIPSALGAFARMTDEDAEYVINKCLSVSQIQQGQTWAPVRKANITMFADLTLQETMQLAFVVMRESLGIGFFLTDLPKASAAGPAA
jgi:hypothetical protein